MEEPVLPGHAGRGVGAHEGQAAGCDELGVHDAVGGRRVLGVAAGELAEGGHGELPAEDVLVELHRLTGVVRELDVGIQCGSHAPTLDPRADNR